MEIRRWLARDERDTEAQRELSDSFDGLGDVLLPLGDVAGARDAYQKCLDIRLKLAADETNIRIAGKPSPRSAAAVPCGAGGRLLPKSFAPDAAI